MTRVTRAGLNPVVTRINVITNSPEEFGRPGNFYLDGAYGGYSLRRTTFLGGDEDVLQVGYLKPKELLSHLHSFIRGLSTRNR